MYNMKISHDVSRYTKFEVIIMPVVRLPLFVAVAAVRVIGAVAGHRSSDVLEREKGYLPALFRSWGASIKYVRTEGEGAQKRT